MAPRTDHLERGHIMDRTLVGRASLFLAAVLLLSLEAPAAVPAGFTETQLLTTLTRPVALAWLPGARLLIGEQGAPAGSPSATALIRMYKNGMLEPTPYATITPVYRGTGGVNNNESGLLGLAVDPNFGANGYVYAFVSVSAFNQTIFRFTTSGDVGTTQTTLVDGIPMNGVNHDGGGMCFGPDGFLYVCVGENGTATQAQAQVDASWRGKILRFDTSTVPATPVPVPGNPFGVGSPVFTKGHRHPFRITARPGTSQIFASENGSSVHDEINRLVGGQNYGWPIVEGPSATFANPTWSSGPGVIAITDLLFYPTGSTMPFGGDLFFVGYGSDIIYRATLTADGTGIAPGGGPFQFVTGRDQPVDIEVGPDGALYYSTLTGQLWKVQASGAPNMAPFALFAPNPPMGAPPLTVVVWGGGSYDTDGSIVSHSWNWGDGTANGSGVDASHTYAVTGSYVITLTVTDNLGATGTHTHDVVSISAGNQPPSSHLESATPMSGPAPLTVAFVGHGHDPAPPGDLLEHRWDFGDGSPFMTFTGRASDENTTPSHTYLAPGNYTVRLRVRDTEGISATNNVMVAVTAPTPAVASGRGGGGGGCGFTGLEAVLAVLLLAGLARPRRGV